MTGTAEKAPARAPEDDGLPVPARRRPGAGRRGRPSRPPRSSVARDALARLHPRGVRRREARGRRRSTGSGRSGGAGRARASTDFTVAGTGRPACASRKTVRAGPPRGPPRRPRGPRPRPRASRGRGISASSCPLQTTCPTCGSSPRQFLFRTTMPVVGRLQLEGRELALGLVDLQLRLPARRGRSARGSSGASPSRSPRESTACRSFRVGEVDVDVGLDDLVAREELRVAALERLRRGPLAAGLLGVAAEVRDDGSATRRCPSRPRQPAVALSARPSARSFTVADGSRRMTTSPAFTAVPSSIIQPILRLTSFAGDADRRRLDRAEDPLGPDGPHEARALFTTRVGTDASGPGRRTRAETRRPRGPAAGRRPRATAPHEESPAARRARLRTESPSARPGQDLDPLLVAASDGHGRLPRAAALRDPDERTRFRRDDGVGRDDERARDPARSPRAPSRASPASSAPGRPSSRATSSRATFSGTCGEARWTVRCTVRTFPRTSRVGLGVEPERDRGALGHEPGVGLVHVALDPEAGEVGHLQDLLAEPAAVPDLLLVAVPVRDVEDGAGARGGDRHPLDRRRRARRPGARRAAGGPRGSTARRGRRARRPRASGSTEAASASARARSSRAFRSSFAPETSGGTSTFSAAFARRASRLGPLELEVAPGEREAAPPLVDLLGGRVGLGRLLLELLLQARRVEPEDRLALLHPRPFRGEEGDPVVPDLGELHGADRLGVERGSSPLSSTERTRSRRSAFAVRAAARSGSGRRGSRVREARRGARARALDADGHPRAQSREVAPRRPRRDAKGHPRRAPADGLGHGGDDSTRAARRRSGNVSGTTAAASPGADPAVVDVEEEGVDPEGREVRNARERSSRATAVSPVRTFFRSRGFSATTKTPSFGARSVSAETAVSSLSLSPRARLEGDELRGAVRLGGGPVGGEVLRRLGELGLGPPAARAASPRAPASTGGPAGSRRRCGPSRASVSRARTVCSFPSVATFALGVEPDELGLGLDGGDPLLLEVRTPGPVASNSATPVARLHGGAVLLEETELERPEGGLGDEEVGRPDGGELSRQEETGRPAPAASRGGCRPARGRLPAARKKRSRRPAGEPPRARAGRVVPFHARAVLRERASESLRPSGRIVRMRTARRRTPPPPDVPSGPLRHRRPRSRAPTRFLDWAASAGQTRLAGPAARADRLRELALRHALGLRRQPDAPLARAPRRRRAPAGRGARATSRASRSTASTSSGRRLKEGLLREAWRRFRSDGPGAPPRRAPGVRRGAGPAVLARRLGALHGAEGAIRRAPPSGSGPRTCAAATRPRSRAPSASSPTRSPGTSSSSSSSSASGTACATRRTSAGSGSSATSRSTSRPTAPTSGRTRSSSSSTRRATRCASRASRPTTSARPASSGGTRSTAGTSSRRTASPGGSSGCGRTSRLTELLRLDHFRGFAAYWEVPAGAETAISGTWVPGPGRKLFDALRAELGDARPRRRGPRRDHPGRHGAARRRSASPG